MKFNQILKMSILNKCGWNKIVVLSTHYNSNTVLGCH